MLEAIAVGWLCEPASAGEREGSLAGGAVPALISLIVKETDAERKDAGGRLADRKLDSGWLPIT